MTNTTQPTPADLAALVADLNTIIAEQEARLRSQESQISKLYSDVVRLTIQNRWLSRKEVILSNVLKQKAEAA